MYASFYVSAELLPVSALAAPSLQLNGEEVVVTDKGKSQTLSADEFAPEQAIGKALRYLGFGEEAQNF